MPIKNYRELQRANINRQKGLPEDFNPEELAAELGSNFEQTANPMGLSAAEQAYQSQLLGEELRYNNMAEELGRAGFGTDRRDARIDMYDFLKDPEDARARAQSDFNKIGNGLAKMGTTAVTTAADYVAGTVAGLLNIAKDAVDGDGFHPGKSFVQNDVSVALQKVNDVMEKVFPNYRTADERSDDWQNHWWKHLNANFWGDTVLKNLGFTVGAIGGSLVGTGVFSKAMGFTKKMSSNLFKAAVAAAEGDTEALAALKNIGVDVNNAYMNASKAAKQLKNMRTAKKLFGSVGGAVAEARVEGVGAANEFATEMQQDALDAYNAGIDSLEDDMYAENQSWFVEKPMIDETGNYMGMQRALTEEGARVKAEREQKLLDEYGNNTNYIDKQAGKLATTVFLLNVPLLTMSDTMQFGRLFAEGFKGGRKLLSQVGGSVLKSAKGLAGGFEGKGSFLKDVMRGIANPMSEGVEEISQKMISEGAKNIGKVNVAGFNNDGYDKDTIHTVGDWLNNMTQSVKDVLGDNTSWEEFAVGALTGLLGFPASDIKNWQGGIIGGYMESRTERLESARLADKLNKIVGSEEFQNRWRNYIRHKKYEDIKNIALRENNKYVWHTAESEQLINDIMDFAEAGKLDELSDLVDYYANVSEAEAEDLKQMKESIQSYNVYKSMGNLSASEIVDPVRERARQVKEEIKQYKEVYDSIVAREPSASPAKVKEMVYTTLQLHNFESRYLDILDKTLKKLNPILEAASVVNEEGEKVSGEEQTKNLKDLQTLMAKVYGTGYDIANPMVAAQYDKISNDAINEMLKIVPESEKDLRQDLEDMRKLSQARNAYWRKLNTLQDMTDKKFDEQAKTPEKQAAENAKEDTEKAVKTFKTVADVKKYFDELDPDTSEEDKVAALSEFKENNPAVREFLSIRKASDAIREKYIDTEKNPQIRSAAELLLTMKANAATSVEDFYSGAMPTVEQFFLEYFKRVNIGSRQVRVSEAGIKTVQPMYDAAKAALEKYLNQTMRDNKTVTGSPYGESTGYDAKKAAEDSRKEAEQRKKDEEEKKKKIDDILEGKDKEPKKDKIISTDGQEKTTAVNEGKEDASKRTENAEKYEEPEPVPQDQTQKELDKEREDYIKKQAAEELNIASQQAKIDNVNGVDPEELKTHWMQPAFGQINAAAADEWRKGDASADLGDMPEVSKKRGEQGDYSTLWNALNRLGAFEAVNTGAVKRGDKIYFTVDPNFPNYTSDDGVVHISIQMRVGSPDGQVVGLLSENYSKYAGLSELRKDIINDYNEFQKNPDNADKVFAFSKYSTVWFTRWGYLWNKEKRDDVNIAEIPGYKEDAPIIMVTGKGKWGVLRGDPELENSPLVTRVPDRQGTAYYLTKDVNGNYFPIRLNLTHFNATEIPESDPVYSEVKKYLSDFVTKAQSVDAETAMKDINTKNKENLNKIVYTKDLYFSIADGTLRMSYPIKNENGENVTVAGKNQWQEVGTWDIADESFKTPEGREAIVKSMMTELQGLNRPLQVSVGEASAKVVKNLIAAGRIKANMNSMELRGANFYINSYNPTTHEFDNNYIGKRKEEKEEDKSPLQGESNLSEAAKATVQKLRGLYSWGKKNIKFDENTHVYSLDGKPTDYTVTKYIEAVYGSDFKFNSEEEKAEHEKRYAFARQIGNAVDKIARDFFTIPDKVAKKIYTNVSKTRQAAILNDLQRLKESLDKEFGEGQYKVITSEIPVVASFKDKDGSTKTIAGTPDMFIIDKDGNIHLFDFKAKRHPFGTLYNGVDTDTRNYTSQLNGYRQIIEAMIPDFKGKIVDLRLLWFDTSYPTAYNGHNEHLSYDVARYETDEKTGKVFVYDDLANGVPLKDYSKWQTPSLRENVSESLHPLEKTDFLEGVSAIPGTQDKTASQAGQAAASKAEDFWYNQPIEYSDKKNYTKFGDQLSDKLSTFGYIKKKSQNKNGVLTGPQIMSIIDPLITVAVKAHIISQRFASAYNHENNSISEKAFDDIVNQLGLLGINSGKEAWDFVQKNTGKTAIELRNKLKESILAKVEQKEASQEEPQVTTPEVEEKPLVPEETTESPAESPKEETPSETEFQKSTKRVRFMMTPSFANRVNPEQTDNEYNVTKLANLERELAWMSKALPQINQNDRVKIVKGLITAGDKGERAYGRLLDGIMTISDEAIEGTVYHEAFHQVFSTMLTDKERTEVLNEAARVYKTGEVDALEEMLADDFRSWMLTGVFGDRGNLNSKPKKAIQKIVDFFKSLYAMIFNHDQWRPYADRIFKSISSGKYAARKETVGYNYLGESEQARNFDGEFKKEHIAAAIAYLEQAQKHGVRFDIVGPTRNILYDKQYGFTFVNQRQTNQMFAPRSNNAVDNFKKFLGETKNNFEYLPEDLKADLTGKGITEKDFNEAARPLKDQMIMCAGF